MNIQHNLGQDLDPDDTPGVFDRLVGIENASPLKRIAIRVGGAVMAIAGVGLTLVGLAIAETGPPAVAVAGLGAALFVGGGALFLTADRAPEGTWPL